MTNKTVKDAVKDAYLKGAADALCVSVEDLPDDADKAADQYVENVLGGNYEDS